MRLPRQALFAAVLAAHIVLILLLARWRAADAPPPERGQIMLVTQLARPAPSPPPRPPPPVIVPPVLPAETPQPEPAPEALQPAAAPEPSGCAILPAVQGMLVQDPRVPAALATVPADDRSVSNTIMLWDGDWADAAAPGPLDPIRAALAEILHQQPAECLEQALTGPRLFTVTDATGAVSIVIGSGSWRWTDLLAPPDGSREPVPQASIGSHR